MHAVESTRALLHWRRVSREPTRYVTPYAPFQHHDMHHHMYMINMHPQQVVKLGKYHHERSTEEVCWGGEDEEESKDGEGEVCVRARVSVWLRRTASKAILLVSVFPFTTLDVGVCVEGE